MFISSEELFLYFLPNASFHFPVYIPWGGIYIYINSRWVLRVANLANDNIRCPFKFLL